MLIGWLAIFDNITFLIYVVDEDLTTKMSQNPNKRNKDSKEVAEENIEKPIYNEDATLAVEEKEEVVAGQRDTKSEDAASSADSVII